MKISWRDFEVNHLNAININAININAININAININYNLDNRHSDFRPYARTLLS